MKMRNSYPEVLHLNHLEINDRLAVVDSHGSHSRRDVMNATNSVAHQLLDYKGVSVAILCEPGIEWIAAALAVWKSGNIAVPLLSSHPIAELLHPVADANVSVILHSDSSAERASDVANNVQAETINISQIWSSEPIENVPTSAQPDDDALIIYTSGTTGKPKGAVHTHRSLLAMMSGMIDAWEWSDNDRTICVLPLNHVHGIVNVSLCALFVGGVLESLQSFDAHHVWNRIESGDITVFMAVPTVYSRLTSSWEASSRETQQRLSRAAAQLRLMVSGSAALPVSTLEKWKSISSHTLLERYGMTETGMILSNTMTSRTPGHVGWPMPDVDVRVVDEQLRDVPSGQPGELLVRGPQLFSRYWNRPDATSDSYVDGWFRTGDVGVVEPEGYRLMGRSSVDILKTGGEKVSALEIEEVFRTHPCVSDCAVVGVADDEWGQKVAMAFELAVGMEAPSSDEFRAWGKTQLSAAKVPVLFKEVETLPRNTLGKVTKKSVTELFQ